MIDKPLSDLQIMQWIDVCNHEPARQVLRDYLSMRDQLMDFARWGMRFDLNPTHNLAEAEEFWHDYAQRMQTSVKERATEALPVAARELVPWVPYAGRTVLIDGMPVTTVHAAAIEARIAEQVAQAQARRDVEPVTCGVVVPVDVGLPSFAMTIDVHQQSLQSPPVEVTARERIGFGIIERMEPLPWWGKRPAERTGAVENLLLDDGPDSEDGWWAAGFAQRIGRPEHCKPAVHGTTVFCDRCSQMWPTGGLAPSCKVKP